MRAAVVGLRIHNSKPVVFLYSSTGVMQEGLAIAKEQGKAASSLWRLYRRPPQPFAFSDTEPLCRCHGS